VVPKPPLLLTDEIKPPLALIRAGIEALPAIVRAQGEGARRRFVEFFTEFGGAGPAATGLPYILGARRRGRTSRAVSQGSSCSCPEEQMTEEEGKNYVNFLKIRHSGSRSPNPWESKRT
jgi:hypothetical protein